MNGANRSSERQKGHKGDGHLENGRLGGAPLSAPAVFQMHFDPVAAHERGGGFPSPDLFRYRRRGGTEQVEIAAAREEDNPLPAYAQGAPPSACMGPRPLRAVTCIYLSV